VTAQLQPGVVYLLHFSRPISDKHTAQHYAGWAYRLDSRVNQHLKGRGARLTQVARERGITFEIAAAWPGDRNFERKIKNSKNLRRYCPICRKAHDPRQLTLDLVEEDLL
jgi:predicted GIY-YIG superfamily endonuclease